MPPPPHTLPLTRTGTDTHILEPDEQWKADLHRRPEHDPLHVVEDSQVAHNTILNSQPSEESHKRPQRDYKVSINNIGMHAQEDFNRLLRQGVSKRKWAPDVVDNNLPDVARQQQWTFDRTHKADEKRLPFLTNGPQNAKGVLSTSLQQQSDGKQGPGESSEEEYGTGGLEDEVDHNPWQSHPPSRPHVPLTQPPHSKSSVSQRNAPSLQQQPPNSQPTEDNDDYEVDDPHGHPPWRHGSQGNQPYPPGGTPHHQSSGSQASVWHHSPPAPEPSGTSRTFARANGQVDSTGPTGPIQFLRHGNVNSTGSTSSGTGLHRAGSMNSDQYRSSSVAPHGSAERPPAQNHDHLVSNISIAPRLQQTSASASPHDRPSQPTYSTAPRTIPSSRPSSNKEVRFSTPASPPSRPMYSMQRSPEEIRQGVAIPRGPTTPEEGSLGTSRSSSGDFRIHQRHNSKGEQRLSPVVEDLSDVSDDVVGHLDDWQSIRNTSSVHSTMSIEHLTALWETEANRKEDEANRKEEEASRKEEEAHRLKEMAQQSLEEARWLKAEAQRKEEEVRFREIEVQRKEEQARWKEEEQAQWKEGDARKREEILRQKEVDARKREEILKQKEVDARHREDNIRRREEDAQRREMLARQKEKDARHLEEEAWKKEEEANLIKEGYEQKKREIERKEAELKKRLAELLRKEQASRLAQEEASHRAKEDSRLEPEEAGYGDEDAARLEPEETTQADASNRAIEDAESTAPRQEKHQKARAQKGPKAHTERPNDKGFEERHQRDLEEKLHTEQWLLEERRKQEALWWERQEQIRLDEELSRREQIRLNHEALLEQERPVAEAQEREAIRVREEQRRVAEEEQPRVVEEQRRKAEEKSRQRDEWRHQQQQQQDETFRQRAKEEQQREFERQEAQYYQRSLEREHQSTSSESQATPHQSGSTTGSAVVRSNTSVSASSTWPSQLPPMSSSHKANTPFASSSIPLATTSKPLSTGVRPGAPGTSTARVLKGEDRYGS